MQPAALPVGAGHFLAAEHAEAVAQASMSRQHAAGADASAIRSLASGGDKPAAAAQAAPARVAARGMQGGMNAGVLDVEKGFISPSASVAALPAAASAAAAAALMVAALAGGVYCVQHRAHSQCGTHPHS